jgi:hypothetical protein
MGAALHGNLKDFGIAEVFQLIGQQRKTGLLEITGPDATVRLAFDEGAVVWASPVGESEFAVLGDRLVRCGLVTKPRLQELMKESTASARALPTLLVSSGAVAQADLDEINELLSRETIFAVMRWTGGSFHFDAQAVHHDTPPEKLLAAEQILMDGLRMLDEWQTFQVLVPDEDMVFERVGQLEVYKQQVTGDAREERERTPILQHVKLVASAVLPLVILVGLVWMGFERRGAPTQLRGEPVATSPLADVRQDFELRRLRHAIETHRMVAGGWPETLSEAGTADMRGAFALTDSDASPYYYRRREGGILLLAPTR